MATLKEGFVAVSGFQVPESWKTELDRLCVQEIVPAAVILRRAVFNYLLDAGALERADLEDRREERLHDDEDTIDAEYLIRDED
jgi:hypothetical protein